MEEKPCEQLSNPEKIEGLVDLPFDLLARYQTLGLQWSSLPYSSSHHSLEPGIVTSLD